MEPQTRNLIIAVVLGAAIIFASQFFLMPQYAPPPAPATPAETEQAAGAPEVVPGEGVPRLRERAEVLRADPRVPIETPAFSGSINLRGARIDDLHLKRYRETIEARSPTIVLLTPSGVKDFYFAEFGWLASDPGLVLPGPDTLWQAEGETLSPDTPIDLSWDNGRGLRFSMTIAVDEDYLFTVERRVENSGEAPVTLWPFGLIARLGEGDPSELVYASYLVHLGPVGAFNGTLEEASYDDLREEKEQSFESTGGWAGITDKYWIVALVAPPQAPVTGRFLSSSFVEASKYQVDVRGESLTAPPGGAITVADRLIAGAKKVAVLDRYEDEVGTERLDSVVFKFLWFLARPLFYALQFFHQIFGNFGLAILALTVCVRILLFPLANKSYAAMSKMKKLTPQMKELRERYKDDRARLNKETMELYRREKVNPMAGCLPILAQIPVFFALYSVLYTTIEMRHAPFFGWIKDLSAPDPYSVFNLFGLIPIDLPSFLMIGAWPLLMGITMFLQFRLNPTPPDPIQAKIMMILPLVFVFILAPFPAGLVIYWSWNNLLSIAQQWIIMRRMGVSMAGGTVPASSGGLRLKLPFGRAGKAETPGAPAAAVNKRVGTAGPKPERKADGTPSPARRKKAHKHRPR